MERAVIEVFGGCNYKCKMCPQTTGRQSSFLRKMPLDMFESILDQLPGKPIINLEGSGEPTMVEDLDKYISACSSRGLKSFIYCNGSGFTEDLMKRCLDAGLTYIRFSIIGYTPVLYKEWMSEDNWGLIVRNIQDTKSYIAQNNLNCTVASYHLILNKDLIDYEVDQYKNNIIDNLDTVGYIWLQHNWSGNYQPGYTRKGKRRSCGRPFANEITVRAGGIDGLQGAVTPCCQTLGPPNESASVLGHFQNQTFDDIWYGDDYNHLRKAHELGEWPSYCENCDFLYEDREVLVWSNDPNAKIGRMIGTELEIAQ